MARNGEIRLGDKVRDDVTGLEGIAIGVTTWLNGCRRIIVQPQAAKKSEKAPDTFSCDEPNVSILKRGVVKGMNTGDAAEDVRVNLRTGGPAPTPRQNMPPIPTGLELRRD